MDFENILNTIQPFLVLFVALLAAFMTAIWISSVIWAFRDIRARTRDIFAQILATLMVLIFFPLFPLPGLVLYMILRPRETLAEIYERTLEEEALLQGIEERLACPGCNRRIAEDYLVCPSCHTRLKKGCVSCGRLLHLQWSVCPYCAASQTTAQPAAGLLEQPPAMTIEPPPEAERIPAETPVRDEVLPGGETVPLMDQVPFGSEAPWPEVQVEPPPELEDEAEADWGEVEVEPPPELEEEAEADWGEAEVEPPPELEEEAEADWGEAEPWPEAEADAAPAATGAPPPEDTPGPALDAGTKDEQDSESETVIVEGEPE